MNKLYNCIHVYSLLYTECCIQNIENNKYTVVEKNNFKENNNKTERRLQMSSVRIFVRLHRNSIANRHGTQRVFLTLMYKQ